MELGPYELGPNDTPENGIYCGDARELAKAIPDESVDFVFADPPYWVGYDYGNRTDEQMEHIDPAWFVEESLRIARIACVTPGIGNIWAYPQAKWVISWVKPASSGRSGLGGFNIWEPVLVYGNCEKRFWQDSITAAGGREFAGAFNKCPKPLKLLNWLIRGMTANDSIIFDPVVGSGTTAVSAKQLGRNYLAFEIDPDTCEMARERVRNTQPPLFIPEPEQQLQMI